MKKLAAARLEGATMRKLGAGAFVFFLIKGLLWLLAPLVLLLNST